MTEFTRTRLQKSNLVRKFCTKETVSSVPGECKDGEGRRSLASALGWTCSCVTWSSSPWCRGTVWQWKDIRSYQALVVTELQSFVPRIAVKTHIKLRCGKEEGVGEWKECSFRTRRE